MFACQNGHSEVCIAFHAIPVPHLFYASSVHVFTCMSVTLLPNHEQVALDLIKAGADIEKPNNNGWTPLMKACSNGHSEVCIAFLCYPGVAYFT